MEPRFHTGDLAVVRPAERYTIGEVVAYRSTLLHVTVLHRIVARYGGRYVFKGDHNNFLDPVRPDRSELLGKLWFRVPHGGVLLGTLHTPYFAAALVGCLGVLTLVGAGEERRRRRRRRSGATSAGHRPAMPVTPRDHTSAPPLSGGVVLAGAAVAAVLFLGLCLVAFTRPASRPVAKSIRYVQEVGFGYRAGAPAGLVYPDGIVRTGDPIFTQLVHRVSFEVAYHFSTTAPHRLAGPEQIALELLGPGGWSRSLPLASPTRFTGDRATARVNLELARVQQLMDQLGRQIGTPSGGFSLRPGRPDSDRWTGGRPAAQDRLQPDARLEP